MRLFKIVKTGGTRGSSKYRDFEQRKGKDCMSKGKDWRFKVGMFSAS